MILRNHGLLTCAENIPDAFLNMFILQRACEIQVKAQAGGAALTPIPQPIVDGIRAAAAAVTRGANGRIAWPALLRRLDRIDRGYAS
jgi:ribulose-5-phosphate 4-epimerase/fuculose-1-phosphate aldolase